MKEKMLSNRQFKLFFSYFFVFFIPAVCISSAVFRISDKIIREELQSNHSLRMSTASYNLSNTLESFSMAATAAAYSGFGHPVNLEKEITTASQLIGLLNRTGLSYDFVQDIFMIYRDNLYVYSGQTSFTRDNFYRHLQFSGLSPQQAAALLENTPTICCLPVSGLPGSLNQAEKEAEYILFCFPCARGETIYGTMAFLVDTEKLNRFLGNNGSGGYLYLVGPDFAALNPNPEYEAQLQAFPQKAFTPADADGPAPAVYADGAFFYTYSPLLSGIVSLAGIADSKDTLARLLGFRNLVFALLAALFLLGTLLVLFVWQRKRRQLLQLTDSYEARLKQIVPLRRQEILYALIEGRYLYENDFTIQCEESMMEFAATYHYCVLLPPDQTGADMEPLLSKAAGFHVTLAYSYYVHKTADVCVWLVGAGDALPVGPKQLAGLRLLISRPVLRILDIHNAYSETLSLHYLQQSPHTRSQQGKGEENDSRCQPHYDRLLNRINDCLSTADQAGLKNWGESLLADMAQDGLSFGMRQKLLLQLFITYPDADRLPFTIQNILEMHSDNQLEEGFRSLFACRALVPSRQQENQESNLDAEKIAAYIRENYTDPAFSLQVLADHFHVSNSYLSWFFKQKNGVTVLDYTTQLKMELATRLLRQGHSLQQVALQVGYINVSSFIRRFKQTMGMTPGEYKKEFAQGGD